MQLSLHNFIPHIYYYAQSIFPLQRDPLGVPLLFLVSKRQTQQEYSKMLNTIWTSGQQTLWPPQPAPPYRRT